MNEESNQEVNQFEDQYVSTGAPNFETALMIAVAFFENLEHQAQEDMSLMIVDRSGSAYILGTGEVWPNNENAPVPSGFIIYRDDIVEYLNNEDPEDGEDDEVKEATITQIGNEAKRPTADDIP